MDESEGAPGPGGASMGDPAVSARSSLALSGPGRLMNLFLFLSFLFIQERFSSGFYLFINYYYYYLINFLERGEWETLSSRSFF